MRNAFIAALVELAESDERIEFVIADVGFGLVEPFAERFPTRFVNAGVAEQNMTGVAAGLALTGSVVFTYSIGNFPTIRCLEQIRSDIAYHRANVKIVAAGGGVAYGALGFSHHATEDLGIMRMIPGVSVAAAGDPLEARALTRALAAMDGPGYLRLGRSGEAPVHAEEPSLVPGSSVEVREGDEIALFVIGGMLPTAVQVAASMEAEGYAVRVVSMPWLSPLDTDAVRAAAGVCKLIVTLEEHSVRGGLGTAVAEVLTDSGIGTPLCRIGLPEEFTSVVGSQAFLLAQHGLDEEGVQRRIEQAMEKLVERHA